MIARPTTDQLIADLRAELAEMVLPAVQDQTVQVTVQMFDQLLSVIAVRCTHEIAWMREETLAMEHFVREVAEVFPDDPSVSEQLRTLDDARSTSLHLDDVVETYSRAGAAFGQAIDVAARAGDAELLDRARVLLDTRTEHDAQMNIDYTSVGR